MEEESEVDGVYKTDSDKIYLFARNDPDKELWFHRLNIAAAFDLSAVVDEPAANKRKTSVEEYNKFLKAYVAYLHNVYESSNYPILTNKNQKKTEVRNTNSFITYKYD